MELKRGRCTLKEEDRDGTLIAAASVIGANASLPKSARKGHENCFRLDLPKPDSQGCQKYVVSVDTEEERDHWMHCFSVRTPSLGFAADRHRLPRLVTAFGWA